MNSKPIKPQYKLELTEEELCELEVLIAIAPSGLVLLLSAKVETLRG